MTKAIVHTYTFIQEYCRRINLILIAACATLVLIYAFNLYRVISHTIALQRVTKDQNAMDTSIQALDSQYLAISSKISPDALQSYGFDQGKITAFISRTTALGRATPVGHEL
jgi:hypothetical protein